MPRWNREAPPDATALNAGQLSISELDVMDGAGAKLVESKSDLVTV
ncbi:hypothetical protein ACIQC5_14845 [Paenarthrobacter sp. NPDC092416]